MSTLPVKFRAKSRRSFAWSYGFYAFKEQMKKHFILNEEIQPYSLETHLNEIEVFEHTVCQLRHVNQFGEYYDHDVYYHAGFGFVVVSDVCQIQTALFWNNPDDICEIVGNDIDEPNIFNRLTGVNEKGYTRGDTLEFDKHHFNPAIHKTVENSVLPKESAKSRLSPTSPKK